MPIPEHSISIDETDPRAVSKQWQWRDREENFHYPKDMDTRHLFFTLRMIWNHNMPVKLIPYNRYHFGKFYTSDYMQTAIKQIGRELMTRKDIKPEWQYQLSIMAAHFGKEDQLLTTEHTEKKEGEIER